MKLNISYPINGTQKLIEIDDDAKLCVVRCSLLAPLAVPPGLAVGLLGNGGRAGEGEGRILCRRGGGRRGGWRSVPLAYLWGSHGLPLRPRSLPCDDVSRPCRGSLGARCPGSALCVGKPLGRLSRERLD